MKIKTGDQIKYVRYHPALVDEVGATFSIHAVEGDAVLFSDGEYLDLLSFENFLNDGTYEIISSCPEESSSCLVTIQLNCHIDDVIRELRAMRRVWPNARVRNSDLGLVVEK